jgi:hypothetical protein
MKKLLLITAILLFSYSCSKEDDGCVCKSARYCIFGQDDVFYVENVPIDCETKQPIKPLTTNPNAIYCGCED